MATAHIPASVKTDIKKEMPKEKINLRYIRDKHREPVKGKFIFHEVPGGTLKFPFKEFKEDKTQNYTLVDGQIYTIPLGVAKHLNKNCWYPVHAYVLDEYGKPTQQVGKKVRRCSFQSLEFVDVDDLTPVGSSDIVTVENVVS